MNNTIIAKELLKIAKDILSFTSENQIVDNDINIITKMKQYNGMKFPGKFIIISCPFQKIVKFKQDIKKIGFSFDPSSKQWYIFHKKLSDKGYSFNDVVNLIKDKVQGGVSTTTQPVQAPVTQTTPIPNTSLKQSSLELSFGYVQFEGANLCFIVDPNELCLTYTGDFIKNLTTFCNECNEIVKALKNTFGNVAQFTDVHFNGINEYEMHGDGQIFNNLYVLSPDKSIFNKIKEFFKQNNIKFKNF